MLDDHLPGNGEKQDLHSRTPIVAAEHFQKLNADDNGEGGREKAAQALRVGRMTGHDAQLGENGAKGQYDGGDDQKANQDLQKTGQCGKWCWGS